MKKIQVREGQSISLRELQDSIPAATALETLRHSIWMLSSKLQRRLGLREQPLVVEDSEEACLRFRAICGTLNFRGLAIDIAPKFALSPNYNWQAIVLVMLQRSARRRIHFSPDRPHALKPNTFVDQFAYSYSLALENALQKDPVRMYRAVSRESSFLRGRLLVSEQLKNTYTRPHKLIVEESILDEDNAINRLLHFAGAKLQSVVFDPLIKRHLSTQLRRLPSVTKARTVDSLAISIPPQYRHYANAVDLAMACVRGQGTFPGATNVSGVGVLVGTERLFESFVENSLAVALEKAEGGNWTAIAQASALFARADPGTKARGYWSRPDNIVRLDGNPVLIVDAKYKRFAESEEIPVKGRPTNSDVYQMLGASVSHGCSDALLLYPRMISESVDIDLPSVKGWTVNASQGKKIRIKAASLDLSLLKSTSDLSSFDEKVLELITTLVESGPSDDTV